jgi:hypothetical protein
MNTEISSDLLQRHPVRTVTGNLHRPRAQAVIGRFITHSQARPRAGRCCNAAMSVSRTLWRTATIVAGSAPGRPDLGPASPTGRRSFLRAVGVSCPESLGELRAPGDIELREYVGEMGRYGAHGEHHLFGDLPVAQSTGGEICDGSLLRGQTLQPCRLPG